MKSAESETATTIYKEANLVFVDLFVAYRSWRPKMRS